jgi:hypothetical protein
MKKKLSQFLLIYSLITLAITSYHFINPVLTKYYWCPECTGNYYDYSNFFTSLLVFIIGYILIFTLKIIKEIKEGIVNIQNLKLMRNIYISISLLISGFLYVYNGNYLGVIKDYYKYSILISVSLGIILYSLMKFKIDTYKRPNA